MLPSGHDITDRHTQNTADTVAYTRPAQDWVNQNPSMAGGGAYRTSALDKKLLAGDGCEGGG